MSQMSCAVCGGKSFTHNKVLWDGLVAEWDISDSEREYIDRQQGSICNGCGCNIRSIALAKAIMNHWSYHGRFQDFTRKFDNLAVLEINEASGLTKQLASMSNRRLAEYPEIDMQRMPYPDASFDLVVHSDTLEHIQNPVRALSECKRVLRPGGVLAYTIPVIVGRMTRSREGLAKSYHGFPGNGSDDYVVHTEYGADMWQQVIAAGFKSVKIETFDYPAGIAISASTIGPIAAGLVSRLVRAIRN